MYKFSIVETGSNKKDLPFLIQELRRNKLIAGTEKDVGGETIYHTHNLVAVKRIIEDYDNFMLDLYKD